MEKDSLKQSGYFWTLKLRCLGVMLCSSGPGQNAVSHGEGWQLTINPPPSLIKTKLMHTCVLWFSDCFRSVH